MLFSKSIRFPQADCQKAVNDKFSVRRNNVVIKRGSGLYNLTMHCPGGRVQIVAGSRPMFLIFNPFERHKYGELSLGMLINEKRFLWFHEFDNIKTTYAPGHTGYVLRHTGLGGAVLHLDVTPLTNAEGVLVRFKHTGASALAQSRLVAVFGGLAFTTDFYCPWEPGRKGAVRPRAEDCAGNRIVVDDDGFLLTHRSLPEVMVCGTASLPGSFKVTEAMPNRTGLPMAVFISDRFKSLKTASGDFAVAWGKQASIRTLIKGTVARADHANLEALQYASRISGAISTTTPDAQLDAGIRFANYSADACWRPPAFFHSSSTWTGWYVGWRGLYGPTVCGWHNRVRSALMFHGGRTTHPDKFPRDERMNRLENAYTDPLKREVGRIHMTAYPQDKVVGGHHDCDQLFIDFLHHHYCWTGDIELAAELWPVLTQAMRWQKAARDPDDDGLYTNVLNTWISDSHEYHQGACTVQSAYLWRNNVQMAELARRLDKDPRPYDREAVRIRHAMEKRLWLKDRGIYAEYIDVLGTVHPDPEVTSIFHPIEFGLPDAFKSFRMLAWMRRNLLRADGLVAASRWLPTARCLHKTPFVCETLNMALAAYYTGESDLAYRMLRASFDTYGKPEIVRSGVYIPFNPQNDCGQVDMLENASLFQRTIVEGLFGIRPRVQDGVVIISPAFPRHWKHASIRTPDIEYSYLRQGQNITILARAGWPIRKVLRLALRDEIVSALKVDGKESGFRTETGLRACMVEVDLPEDTKPHRVEIILKRRPMILRAAQICVAGEKLVIRAEGCRIRRVWDPAGRLNRMTFDRGGGGAEVKCPRSDSDEVVFAEAGNGRYSFYEPLEFRTAWPVEIHDARFRTERGRLRFECQLANNTDKKQNINLTAAIGGQRTNIQRALPAGKNRSAAFALTDAGLSGVTPGTNRVCLSGGEAGMFPSEALVTDWNVAGLNTVVKREVSMRTMCIPLDKYCNGRIEEICRLAPPEVRYGYHATPEEARIDKSYLRSKISAGVFNSDAGVPFRLSHGKKKAVYLISPKVKNLFVQGCLTLNGSDEFYAADYPSTVRIPVGKSGLEKVYLMFMGSTSPMQSFVPAVRVRAVYDQGPDGKTVFSNPETFDFYMEHASRNFGQPLNPRVYPWDYKYYRRQFHADIADVILDATRRLNFIELTVVGLDTAFALLGLTIVRKKGKIICMQKK